jgi:DNA-binding FrmR family transcriptional regulator
MSETPTRGYTNKKDDFEKRLKRIEGQIRGIAGMIDDDVYCIDVLTQISAATRALQAVAVNLLDEHVRHCVRDAITAGDHEHVDTMISEATKAIERLVKA